MEVYGRPARDAAKVLERGGTPEQAFEAFEKRLEGIVEADVIIADRDELKRIQDQLEADGLTEYSESEDAIVHDDDDATELMSRDEMEQWIERFEDNYGLENKPVVGGERVIGWRRVIRPELSRHGSCGLCVVAATQWYTRGDLQAIHHLCKCATLPVTKSADPGLRWNAEDLRRNLDEIYGAGGGTAGKKLKRIRVAVREHGELGPMLAYSAKRGWTPIEGFEPYTPPNASVQKERLSNRRSELEATLSNLRARSDGDGNREGIDHAIWEVEQSLKELDARLAA